MRRVKGMLLGILGFDNAFQFVRMLWTLLELNLGLGSGHGTNPTRDHHLLVLLYKVLDSLNPRLILFLSGRLIRSLVDDGPRWLLRVSTGHHCLMLEWCHVLGCCILEHLLNREVWDGFCVEIEWGMRHLKGVDVGEGASWGVVLLLSRMWDVICWAVVVIGETWGPCVKVLRVEALSCSHSPEGIR